MLDHKLQRWTFTLLMAAVAIIHLVNPKLAIDQITLALLVLAAVPWLAPLFRSIEFPGGGKIEFQELRKVEADAKEAGLLDESIEAPDVEYTFQQVEGIDANLALAGLRIELEKALRDIAKTRGLSSENQSLGRLLNMLHQKEFLTIRQVSVLHELVSILNKAVHGGDVGPDSFLWAMDVGPKLLETLKSDRNRGFGR